VEQFARAIRLDPNYAAAYSGLVDACNIYHGWSGLDFHPLCPRDPEEGLTLARRAVQLDDQCGEAWISLAWVLAKRWNAGGRRDQRLRDEIERAYRRGLVLSPSYAQGYHWYATLLANEPAQHEQVMQILRDGLRVDPLAIQLHYWLSIYADGDGDFETAREHAERIVEIAPNSPLGHVRVADIQRGVDGRFDLAIRGFLRAARIDPWHHGYYRDAGLQYLALQDYDSALAYVEEGAALVETRRRAWEQVPIALPLMHMGRTEEAGQRLRESLERLTEGARPVWQSSYAAWLLTGLDLSAGHPEVALARYKRYWPSCFEAEPQENCCYFCAFGIARVRQALGATELAERLLEPECSGRLEEIRQRGGYMRFGRSGAGISDVSCLAMLGRKEEALDALEDAVRQGYRGLHGPFPSDAQYDARFDASFDSIRDDPRFKAAFAVIEADMVKQLASVREMERRGEIPTLDELRKLRASTPDRGAAQEID